MLAPNSLRGMDGLVVCAMGGTRHRQGFEPRFVRPSRGPLARSPPPPPSTSPSTIGTAGGWVACLVHVVLSYVQSTCHRYMHLSGLSERKAKKQGTGHNTPAAVTPVTVSSSYSPWGIRTAVFGAAAGCTAAAVRGPKTVTGAPKSQQYNVTVHSLNKQRLGL